MKRIQYPIVEVVWIDAEEKGEVGWNSLTEMKRYAKKPCPTMRSVGYKIYQDEDHISLLSSIGQDECSSIEKIPTGFIKTITELTPKNDQVDPGNDQKHQRRKKGK